MHLRNKETLHFGHLQAIAAHTNRAHQTEQQQIKRRATETRRERDCRNQ